MKQIFDWLREEAQEEIMPKGSVSKTELLIKSSCYGKVLALIDEAEAKFAETECGKCSKRSWYQKGYADAEAKWEKDCCIWKLERCGTCEGVMDFLREPHFGNVHQRNKGEWNYCNTCGKPIKILEVE